MHEDIKPEGYINEQIQDKYPLPIGRVYKTYAFSCMHEDMEQAGCVNEQIQHKYPLPIGRVT